MTRPGKLLVVAAAAGVAWFAAALALAVAIGAVIRRADPADTATEHDDEDDQP